MSKTVKFILFFVVGFIIIALISIGFLSWSVYQTVQQNSCYKLQLAVPQNSNFTTNTFVEAFNEASQIPLSQNAEGNYLGESSANFVKVMASHSSITVNTTQALGFDQAKKQFVAEHMGVAIGAAMAGDVDSISEIKGVATQVETAFDAGQPYSTRLANWDINFTSACQ